MTMKTLTILFLATLAHTFAAAHSTPWPPTGSSRPMGLIPKANFQQPATSLTLQETNAHSGRNFNFMADWIQRTSVLIDL